MKTSVIKGEVFLPAAPRVDWEVKIGAEHDRDT